MPTITDIAPQKKDPKRVNVWVDGEFWAGMDSLTAYTHLSVGQDYESDFLEEVLGEELAAKCFNYAARVLNYGTKTIHQMRTKMQEKEFPNTIIDTTIQKLLGYGFIYSDKEYAEMWVKSKMKGNRAKGKYALQKDLRLKGVSQEWIDAVLSEIDEYPPALEVAQNKYPKCNPEDDFYKAKNKLYKYLISRGFSGSVVSDVVSEVCVNKNEEETYDE